MLTVKNMTNKKLKSLLRRDSEYFCLTPELDRYHYWLLKTLHDSPLPRWKRRVLNAAMRAFDAGIELRRQQEIDSASDAHDEWVLENKRGL